ncbi:MAG: hypothetical protein H6Q74_2597 [Firmicutes bacterium]|nr:hypothetical protein [Bacillota bacterium]
MICRHRKNQQGFTLIETVVTVAIIAVLAAIGVNELRVAIANRELARAAWELAADIRWMQQLSANDVAEDARVTLSPSYRYKLLLWASDYTLQSTSEKTNYYQVLDSSSTTALKKLSFDSYHVKAKIIVPSSATSASITYYAYDVDRIKTGTTLENISYQIMLTHSVTGAVIYVNVDSRVGRVWTNTDGTSPL